tara:strand:+ start:1227 stop:1691 length:465 start_codon:yes stop_codon:yes gene_type:complete
MLKIVDNWLNKDLVDYLENYFLYRFPHYYGHKSNDEDINSFYVSSLNIEDALNNYLFFKLEKTLNKKLQLNRMYINIQHENMTGSFHKDDGDITCLYMVTKTLADSGEFEIKEENKIKFVQNRLIAFDAKKEHRGLAPNKGEVRITLAFKTNVL